MGKLVSLRNSCMQVWAGVWEIMKGVRNSHVSFSSGFTCSHLSIQGNDPCP